MKHTANFLLALVAALALTGCIGVSGEDAQTAHAMCRQFDAQLVEVRRTYKSPTLVAECDGGLSISLKIKEAV